MDTRPPPQLPPPRIRWPLIVIFWVAFWALLTTIRYVFTYHVAPPGRYPAPIYGALADAVQFGSWALLTPAILRLGARMPITRDSWHWRIPLHLGIGVATVLGVSLLMVLVQWPMQASKGGFEWTLLVVGEMLLSYGTPLFLLLYAGLVATGFALHSHQALQAEQLRAAVVARQLTDARLHALRMQLQPHFLYNTLNTVASLTESDPPAARRVIASLGELLRETLESAQAREVPLERELQLSERYLDIVRARVGPRLRVTTEVDAAALDALVPPMLLQPLLENAYQHGVAAVAGEAHVAIEAHQDSETVRIRIRNTASAEGSGRRGSGVGLGTTRERLEEMYGPAAGVSLQSAGNGEVVAVVWLPYHTSRDMQEMAVSEGARR